MAFNSFGATSSFGGAPANSTFGFGNQASSNSGFGFGSKPATSGFGSPSTGGFGTASTLGGSSNMFGQPSTNTFGSPSAAGGFTKSFSTTTNLGGLGGSTGAFGSSASGGFGASAFGAKPAGSPSTPFGGGGGAFGASSQTLGGGGGAFGGGAFGNPAGGNTFGSSAFGSPAATNAFGAPAANASPFGAAASAFGGGGNTAFGSSAAPAFGAASGVPAFGASAAPAFGSSAAPAFGSAGTSAFGGGGNAFGAAANTQPGAMGGGFGGGAFGSGSAFGQPAAAVTNAFGSPGLGGGGAFGVGAGGAAATGFGQAASSSGTGNPKFSPLMIQETVNKAGINQVTALSLQVISGMAAYNTKSMEELRFEDYQRGNKTGNAIAGGGGAFGLGSVSSASPFGQPAAGGGAFGGNAFGAPAAAPAASNPFGGGGTTSAFGASSAPAFGSAFGSTAAPAFGAAAAPAFGAPATSGFGSNAFGSSGGSSFGSLGGVSSSTGSAFGSTASTPFGGSTFGSTAFGASNATPAAAPTFGSAFGGGGAFGQQQPQNTSFGAAPAGGMFGQAPSGAFGVSSLAAPSTSSFSFGGATAAPSTAGNAFSFGQPAAAAAAAGGGGFGSTAPSSSSSGMFGSAGGTTGGFGSFGAPAASTNTGFGGFGASSSTAQPSSAGFGFGSAAGGGGGFGQPNKATTTTGFGGFGSPQPTGSAAGFGFGSTAPSTGFGAAPEGITAQQQAQLDLYIASQLQMRDAALKIDMMLRHQNKSYNKNSFLVEEIQKGDVEEKNGPTTTLGSFKNLISGNRLSLDPPVYPRSYTSTRITPNSAAAGAAAISRTLETPLIVPASPAAAGGTVKTPSSMGGGRGSKLQLALYSSNSMMNEDPLSDLPPAQYFNSDGTLNSTSKSSAVKTGRTPVATETPARPTTRGGEATGLTPYASVLTPMAASSSSSSSGTKKGGEDDHQRHISFHLSPHDKSLSSPSAHGSHHLVSHPTTTPPTLTKPGYFTSPDMEYLLMASDEELSCIKDFTVFRPNFGAIRWLGDTDVRGLNLDACVRIDKKEVFVYENMDTPLVGTQLNKRAVVTLQNVFPKAGSSEAKKQAYVEKLREFCALNDAEFVNYDGSTGDWSFEVKHFSRYGLDENFEDQLDKSPQLSSSADKGGTDTVGTDAEASSSASPSSPSRSRSNAPHASVPFHSSSSAGHAGAPASQASTAPHHAGPEGRIGGGLNSLPDSGRKMDSGRKSVSTNSTDDVLMPPTNSSRYTFDPFHADSFSVTMNPAEFYLQFWERTYSLFYEVCDPYKNCDDCLCIIEDLAIFVRQSCGQVSMPVVALALDVVVQRAMYELSDKTTRRLPDAASAASSTATPPSASTQTSTVPPPACSVANIEHCIAIMMQVISPLITKLGDNIKSPIPLNDKVSTLTRQLQELISWSSFHSQVVVPDSFPKYTVSAPDAELGAEDSGLKLHSYPQPNNPSMSSYSNPTVRVLDDTISNLVREVAVTNMIPVDLVHNVQARVHKILNSNSYGMSPGRGGGGIGGGPEIGITVCGSVQLSLMDAESKKEIDFVTTSVPFNFNFHNLPVEARKAEMRIHQSLLTEKNSIEKIVGCELLADGALKHFRACLKDFRNLASEFLNKFSEYAHTMGPNVPYESDVYGRIGVNNGGGSHGYNNNDFAYMDSTYQTLMHAIRANVDVMRAQSDGLVDRYTAMKDAAQRQNPNISVLTKRLEAIQMQLDYKENERFSAIRRAMTTIEKQLKESGYNYVRVITHKTRFMHLKFIYQEYGMDVIPCNLIVHNVLPLQTSDLLDAYMSIDKSGKIRDFIHVVKLFAKSHRIADPTSGFLSSTAWHVMAIHVLLHFEFLPNLHMDKIYRADTEGSGGNLTPPNTHRSAYEAVTAASSEALQDIAFATPRSMYLPAKYVTKIENTSIIEMLDIFFRYYVEQIDVFRDVVTLKDKGVVLKKADGTRPAGNIVLWRLSVEDPFDHTSSQHPYDLGSTLSRPGQLTTFKALRRAIYGIHSIVSVGIDSCFLNVKKFFSRTDLITLARKSDYLGAVITETPVWSSVNPGPERSQPRSQPYGNVSLTETVDLTPLASLNMAFKTSPSSVHHGMVPKLSLNFHPSSQQPPPPSHDPYSARSNYESLSARGNHPGYGSQSREINTSRSLYSARSGMGGGGGGMNNDPYLVSPRQDPYNNSNAGPYHSHHQLHGPPHLQHPSATHQHHQHHHQQQHQQHHPAHPSHMSQHSLHHHQQQFSGYAQEQWHSNAASQSVPNSARYSQASIDTYDDYSDMDGDYLSPRRYPPSYSSGLHSNSGSQLLGSARGIPVKNSFVPRLPLSNSSVNGGMVADLRYQGGGGGGGGGGGVGVVGATGGGSIISPRMDEYRSQQPPLQQQQQQQQQPLSARLNPGATPLQQQQQQQQLSANNKSLRSDAAVFQPQSFASNDSVPPSTGLSPKKPVIPMIPLSQLGGNGGGGGSGTSAGSNGDRFLDLSSMPRVSPGRDIPLHSSLTPRLNVLGSGGDGVGVGTGLNHQNAEFQEIMEKMTSDALNISHTITSARSTSSSNTVMSALSNANSGTTTLDRFSLASNSTLTPRGTTIEYSDYRQYVVPPSHSTPPPPPGMIPNNKSVSPFAPQHLTPRGGAGGAGGGGGV